MTDFEKLKKYFNSIEIKFIYNDLAHSILIGNQLFQYDDNGKFVKNYIIEDDRLSNPLTIRDYRKCTEEEIKARNDIIEIIKKLGMEHNIYINKFHCYWEDYMLYTILNWSSFMNHEPNIQQVGERIKVKL